VVVNDLTLAVDVDEVVRMQPVVLADVDLGLRLRSVKITPGRRPRSGLAGTTACMPLGILFNSPLALT
jgi:hypothetical protein